MNTNEVDTVDTAPQLTDISEWTVAPQQRRVPEFLRIGVLATEGELVEIPSYDAFRGVARRLDLRIQPDQAYKLAKMIMEAVDGGLGEVEQDRVQLHIELPNPLGHNIRMGLETGVAQCTPSRRYMATEGMREDYNWIMRNAAPIVNGGLDE